MTKCLMREMEHLCSQNKHNNDLKNTLNAAKLIHKTPCKHAGGIHDPDECIKSFVSNRNEEKVFVGTQDYQLKNDLRNIGCVPIFFFRNQVLIMDSPSE